METTVCQRSFFIRGVWFGDLSGACGRKVGIGEGGRSGEGGSIVDDFVPVVEFVCEGKLLLNVGEAREHDLAEEGEGSGFAKGDTVLGCGDEEFAEDVIDIGGGEEIAVKGGGDFAAQALGLEELELLFCMEGAEGTVGRAAQHAAAAAVGKMELAARGDAGAGICVCHKNLLEVDLG